MSACTRRGVNLGVPRAGPIGSHRRTGLVRATFEHGRCAGRLALAGILVIGGAGCAEPRARPERDSAATRTASAEATFRAQVGRTWELARLGDQDIPATPARAAGARAPGRHPGRGSRPTLRFTTEPAGALAGESGRPGAGGWSFCNGYGTAYELGPDDRLRFHGFQSTLVGCDGPDSLETRYFRALHLTRRFELDSSRLYLVAEDGSRLTFVPAPDSAGPPRT